MALYGGWGDGKSSVKCMIVQALKASTADGPFLIEFNPWEWSNQNQLSQAFFEEIGKQLGQQGTRATAVKAARSGYLLRTLGKALKIGSTVAEPVGVLAEPSLPGASIIGKAASKALKKAAEVAEIGADAQNEKQQQNEKSLANIKGELKKELLSLERKILVIVDDVDRLPADEVRNLFQLIKANSDFPNLIFFLLFQRDIVESGLQESIKTGSGVDYLEKIVQVPLTLPALQRPLLESAFKSQLHQILKRRGLQKRFDQARFRKLWRLGLSAYFSNLRDVARFLGAYEFQMASFPTVDEFDPVDLLAVETLRVFDDSVYQRLALARDLAEFDFVRAETEGGSDKYYASILARVTGTRAEGPESPARAILKFIFPLETFAADTQSDPRVLEQQREARVAHPSFFGRYFHFCIPVGDISQGTLQKLLNAAGNRSRFRRAVLRLDEKGLALEGIRRLKAHSAHFRPENSSSITRELFDLGDELAGRYPDEWWSGFTNSASEIIEGHLLKIPDPNDAFELLQSEFARGNSVCVPMALFLRGASALEEARKHLTPGLDRLAFSVVKTKQQSNRLEELCIQRFRRSADSGSLANNPMVAYILRCWAHWDPDPGPVRGFVSKLISSPSGLQTFLEGFLGDELKGDSPHNLIGLDLPGILKPIEKLVSLDALLGIIDRIDATSATPRLKLLCEWFRRLHQRWVRNSETRQDEPAPLSSEDALAGMLGQPIVEAPND